MVLDSYYFGLCRFGFCGLCDDRGTNRVICGLNVFRILILLVFLWLICTVVGGGLREAALVVCGGLVVLGV